MADANFMHCHLCGAGASASASYIIHHTCIFVTAIFINAGVNDAVNAKYITLVLLLFARVESLALRSLTSFTYIHAYVCSFASLARVLSMGRVSE